MYIDIQKLKKTFGTQTAIDIDKLHIADGQRIGVVGNNGAGKTTLFRLLLDLLKADEGDVTLSFSVTPTTLADNAQASAEHAQTSPHVVSINPALNEEWKRYTGAFIDSSFLIDFLTPEEYFNFIATVCALTPEVLAQRLERFQHFMSGEIMGQGKYIRDFSAGNKQKIGIIAAMLGRPQLLILDEPFNFLDPSSQHVLEQLLRSYCNETGATLLLSSHNLQHTIGVSSRIVLLEKGNIIKDLPNDNGNAEAELESYFCGQ